MPENEATLVSAPSIPHRENPGYAGISHTSNKGHTIVKKIFFI